MGKGDLFEAPGDDDLPPPYTPSASTSLDAETAPSYEDTKAGPFSQLPGIEGTILTQILSEFTLFLSSAEKAWPAPSLLESTFVPADAVGPEWTLSEHEEEKGEIKRLYRVSTSKELQDKKGKNLHSQPEPVAESSKAREKGFADWGRLDDEASTSNPSALWWTDEDMARRLARHIHAKTGSTGRPSTQAKSRPIAKSSNTLKFSPIRTLKESFSDPQQVYPPKTPATSAGKAVASSSDNELRVAASAQEVTFRRENEMGLWESKTGWGVVVRVWLPHG